MLEHLLPQIISKPDKLVISDARRVKIRCSCGTVNDCSIRNLVRKWSNRPYLCKSCSVKTYINDPERIRKQKKSYAKRCESVEYKKKLSENGKKAWSDPETRARVSKAVSLDNKTNPAKAQARTIAHIAWMKKHGKKKLLEMMDKAHQALRKQLKADAHLRQKFFTNFRQDDPIVKEKHRASTRIASTKRWQDPAYREKMKKIISDPAFILARQEVSKKLWLNPDYRNHLMAIYATPEFKAKRSAISKAIHQRPEVKAALALIRMNMKNSGKSKIEDKFAQLLDDLGIKYIRQYFVGYYSFDFMIERIGKRKLLIEVNGDWIHSLPEVEVRDRQKATYMQTYHQDEYELKIIWEHEFGSPERVKSIIRDYIDTPPQREYDLKDVMSAINADSRDSKILLSKYHYIGKIGRYGLIIEYRLNNELIACAIFNTSTRSESATRLKIKPNELYELTRFCIHPSYQKKNAASWMLSKAIKLLRINKPAIKCVISFADATFGHSGIIYKASGWKEDGVTEPSYFYKDPDGFVMHKKTLYNYAMKNHMSETEFANKYNYQKISTLPKYRYVFWLSSKI